jgi:hypothetical protein
VKEAVHAPGRSVRQIPLLDERDVYPAHREVTSDTATRGTAADDEH